jgi:hypothetical protein
VVVIGVRLAYSIFGIALDRERRLKWPFRQAGPRWRVFVAGVAEKAIFHYSQNARVYSENALPCI